MSCCGNARTRVSLAQGDLYDYATFLSRLPGDPSSKQLSILEDRKTHYEEARRLLVDHEASCTRVQPPEE